MLRYIYGDDLCQVPMLKSTMFRDRADQFKTRLGWDVKVNENGEEIDQYDALNPLYVIWQMADGTHGGSMRFLPTTGSTMVNDYFSHLTNGVRIESPFIWECTRFCLSRNAGAQVAAALMLAGGEVLRGFELQHFVGVFDARMVRIYRMIGASPTILGSDGDGRDRTSVGLWEFRDELHAKVLQSSGLTDTLSRAWFEKSFDPEQSLVLTA